MGDKVVVKKNKKTTVAKLFLTRTVMGYPTVPMISLAFRKKYYLSTSTRHPFRAETIVGQQSHRDLKI